MKRNFTLLLLLSLFGVAFGKSIDEKTANLVGKNFLVSKTSSSSFKNGVSLELSYISDSKENSNTAYIKASNYFYVFNVSNGNGFVIVSADDNAQPILGYSDEADFNANDIPSNTQKWFELYKNQIRYIIQKNLSPSSDIVSNWNDLISGHAPNNNVGKKGAVNPLVQTKWDQGQYYNELCPYDNTASDRAATGCVATAMAQIMKFWNYPASGTGYHSYFHNKYGTVSANFANTNYDWTSMPNIVDFSRPEVATLMYHCGVGVDMNYDVAANGGSGAYVIAAGSPVANNSEMALKTYFGYKASLQGIKRSDYSEQQWIALLKTELDAGRPILHAGAGGHGGHCFVADGYDNNNFFHFNWGWGGSSDGFFNVNALNPGTIGTGGGTGGFNSDQEAVIGIEPPSSTQTSILNITEDVAASSSSIEYGSSFSITTNLINNGNTTFNGEIVASVFDSKGAFVDYVATLPNTLQAGETFSSNLIFTSFVNKKFLPGNYKVYIYYKPTGTGEVWKQAHSPGLFRNEFASINIKVTSDIEMKSEININPSTFVQGQQGNVSINLKNVSTSKFFGQYQVNLYNLDGTLLETIGTYNETKGLAVNADYSSSLLQFGNTIVSGTGTYLLGVVYHPSTPSNWTFVGSTNFPNPIKINVQAPPIMPDMYEVNNTQADAFNLPLSFTSDSINVNSEGSNIHNGNDYDYYKLVLPLGYNYSIKARIHDSNNSGNSKTYTVDGSISYAINSSSWSDVYDDIITTNINANGGDTLYFLVSPYFTGNTGSYLFDASIKRSVVNSSAKEIISFNCNGIVGNATINNSNATVNLTVSSLTNVKAITPNITVSNFASINPASGVAQDFTNPATYTVTAQDASTKKWTVTVTKQSSGITDVSISNTISIYPNPSNGNITLDLSKLQSETIQIQLLNYAGQILYETSQITKNDKEPLNLSHLSKGMYMLSIHTEQGSVIRKIILE